MKNIFLLLLPFCVSFLNGQTNQPPLITTTGTATVYAPPDEILLNFTISNRSDNIKEVRQKTAKISRKAIEFLNSKSIPDVHIQTQYANVRPVYKKYHKTGGSSELDYFSASQSINICVKNLNEFDDIFDGLIDIGIKTIGRPVFRNSEIKKYKDKARKAAMLAAHSKAKLLAEAINQKVGKAHSIKENFGIPRVNPESYAAVTEMPAGDDNEKLSFAPGQLEIKASVEVAFELD